jgi:hypothetical protein
VHEEGKWRTGLLSTVLEQARKESRVVKQCIAKTAKECMNVEINE